MMNIQHSMMRARFTFLCIALIAFLGVSAQQLHFKKVGVRDGLVDNYVRDITCDKYGFMWFATMNGLSRYDGYTFHNYTVGPLPADNDVRDVFETADTTLWLVTEPAILFLDRKNDRLVPADRAFFGKLGIDDSVRMVTTDERGNLWACSNEHLFYYDYSRRRPTVIPYYSQAGIIELTSKAGHTVALTRDGRFYLADTESRKLCFIGQVSLSRSLTYQRLYIDRFHRLWIYTAHSAVGRPLCFSLTERRWVDTPLTRQLQDIDITSIHHDDNGNLWIATENRGVFIVNDHASETLPALGFSPYGTFSAHINGFYESNNTMWMGSAKQGVAFTRMSNRFFETVSTPREDITALKEDGERQGWIAFDGGGVARMARDGSYTYYNIENGGSPSNIVTAVALMPDGTPWIGTYGAGVARLVGNRFERVRPKGLSSDLEAYVKCLVADANGTLWIGTANDGVIRLNPDGSAEALRSESILSMDIDQSTHRLFIGTSVGLYVYDIQQKRYVTPEVLDSQMGREYVTAIHVDTDGRVIAGSRRGLWIYDETKHTMKHLTTAEGLSHDFVRSIAEDHFHHLWVGTDNGLTRVDTRFRCHRFYDDDGLQETQFFNNAACTLSDGTCLLGSFHGFLRIFPPERDTWLDELRVMFTGLSINGQMVEPFAQEIRINYDDIKIEISVSAMTMTQQSSVTYYYRVNGERAWQMAKGNIIAFHRIPPGSHTIEVKATSSDGRSSKTASLRIIVKPPFYASHPAQVFYGASLIALLWLLFRFFQRRQQYEMEEKKIKFFTNISHDLKTPLSMIIAPLDKALSTDIPENLRVELETAWHNSRVLYNEVNQLLDFRRIDMGSEHLHLSHGNPFDITRDIIRNFEYSANIHQIQTTLSVDGPEFEMDFDENKLRRIISNLLQNAYKYNHPGGSVHITIGSEERGGQSQLVISIADTGRGIKDADKSRIFERFYQVEDSGEYIGTGIGLHIVKEHVEMHGGTITVSDNHPEGSIFTVRIPMKSPETAATPLPVEEGLEVASEEASEGTSTTILVVEDNIEARKFLERSLSDEYTILCASQGREALNVLRHHTVHLVISDIMMPVMNGLELCNYIKSHLEFSHIPVILLTAKSTESNILSGLNEGADDYITKPYNLEILRMRIRKILEWADSAKKQFAKGVDIQPSEITVSSTDQELIAKAIQLVEEHMKDEDFSVSELSAALGMTRGNLYKKLVSITGKTPVEFIRILKVKRGKDLIDQGKTYISEVAYMVGYSSALFSRYFRDAYGCLPSEYIRGKQ